MILFVHNKQPMTDRQSTLHCHGFFEIYYFIQGDIDYNIEGIVYPMRPHTLLLLAPGAFHGVHIRSDKLYERFTLHFNLNDIPQALHDLLRCFDRSVCFYNAQDILLEMQKLEACQALTDDACKMGLNHNLVSLLFAISLRYSKQSLPAQNNLIQNVVAYVNANMANELNAAIIADALFISRSYLEQFFLKQTGSNLGFYIRKKRLARAEQLISQGVSKTDAAAMAGFGNYSTYYRNARDITL